MGDSYLYLNLSAQDHGKSENHTSLGLYEISLFQFEIRKL